MPPGLIACAAALVLAVAVGLIWRLSNGRIRDPRPARVPDVGPTAGRPAGKQAQAAGGQAQAAGGQLQAAGGQLQAAGKQARAAGKQARAVAAWRSTDGPGGTGLASPQPDRQVTVAELGRPLGSRATLLQFSSAFCAPCRATRRILAEVAGMTDGVVHVEIDAESRLDLVRRLDVRRTPTVFVLGPDGEVRKRASGQPRKADVIAVLGSLP